jgi:hypothetical protein
LTPVSTQRQAGKVALGVGVAAAACVLLMSLSQERPFAPGEMDLLLTARAIAGGRPPSLWLGAVHPDAVGTYFGAIVLAPLLFLGMSGMVALKAVAAAHLGVIAGASAGLTTRLAGLRSGLFVGAFLVGTPSLFAAHMKYLATTAEVVAAEVALLWLLYEAVQLSGRRWMVAAGVGGALAGIAVAWSLHALWLALLLPLAWVYLAPKRRWGAVLWLVPAVVVALPWLLASDPWRPPGPMLSVKSLALTALPALIDFADVQELGRRLPWARLPRTWVQTWVAAAFAPGMLVLVGATGWGLMQRGMPRVLAVFVLGAGAPLLIAADLLGYPAGYRYFLPCMPAAAVLVPLAAARLPRPRVLAAAVLLPGLAMPVMPHDSEMTATQAAFVAAHHRLSFSHRPLHTHVSVLTPYVTETELPGWLEGYGLHTARDWVAENEVLGVEFQDAMTMEKRRPPPEVDVRRRRLDPARWLEFAELFEGAPREAFFRGIGLGVGEDGGIEALEAALLLAVPPDGLDAVWTGIGGAVREHLAAAAMLKSLNPGSTEGFSGLRVDAGVLSVGPVATDGFLAGLRTSSPFALPDPLRYSELGARGRNQLLSTAAP